MCTWFTFSFINIISSCTRFCKSLNWTCFCIWIGTLCTLRCSSYIISILTWSYCWISCTYFCIWSTWYTNSKRCSLLEITSFTASNSCSWWTSCSSCWTCSTRWWCKIISSCTSSCYSSWWTCSSSSWTSNTSSTSSNKSSSTCRCTSCSRTCTCSTNTWY